MKDEPNVPLNAVPVPLKVGRLDTKTDDRWAMPGDLVSLQNVVLDNWPKLRKRPGNAQLAQAAAGAQLTTFKSQALLGTGGEAFSYSAAGLIDKGVLESLSVSALPARRDAFVETTPDSAVHPFGITVYTWESTQSGAPAQYSVFDTATGQPIVSAVSLGANASKPKALAIGQYVVIVWVDTSTNHIRFTAIPVSTPTTPNAPADFAIDSNATSVFDCTVIGGLQGQLFLAYANNAGSNKITLKFLTATLVVSSATIPVTAEVFTTCTSIFGDASQNVWVAYYSGSAVKVFVYDFSLSTLRLTFTSVDAAPGTVRNITGIASAGQSTTVLYEVSNAGPSSNNLIKTGTVTLAGAVSGVGVLVRSVGLASKPFFTQGRIHLLVAFQSTLQSTYFLLAGSTVVGKLAPQLGAGYTAKSILPEVNNPSPGVFSTTYLQTTEIGVQAGIISSQAGVMAGTFDFTQPQSAVELSDDLHLSGGILWMYDGNAVCEHGFHVFPEAIGATPSAAGGSIPAGTFQYAFTYEWMDAQGLLHQSAPSPALQNVTSGATSSIAFTIPTLRLTSKPTSVNVVVWRTQSNQSVLFRLNAINVPIVNLTTADTVSFTDTLADTAIGGNAQLIFNPLNPAAELPPLPAPAPLHVWRYRNRIAFIPAENAFAWGFSKSFVGGVPIEFNFQQLFQSVAQDGGQLTCGIEMDDKNVLFTGSRIYYIVGDGPAPNGTGSDYGASPQNIPSDVGCANRRSLVLTPQGVMFQSAKGIYLLGRDLSVSYIGAEVEAFNNLTITRALLVPNSRRVLFFTNGGVVLAWDYYAQKWAVWTGLTSVDAAVFGGLVTHIKAGGQLWQETPGLFTDNGAPILIGYQTALLSFAGIAGFQRVWRFILTGDYRSPHTLIVSVAYDDNPAPIQIEQIAATVSSPAFDTTVFDTDTPFDGTFPAYDWLVKCKQQKCKSIQITVQEVQLGPTYGEGLSLSGLTFLVGSLKGLHPVSKARTI